MKDDKYILTSLCLLVYRHILGLPELKKKTTKGWYKYLRELTYDAIHVKIIWNGFRWIDASLSGSH